MNSGLWCSVFVFVFFKHSFIEIEFTYQTIHPFKVYSLFILYVFMYVFIYLFEFLVEYS